jgi:hypothetical protein
VTPTTEAGRQYLEGILVGRRGTSEYIVAIEAEAAYVAVLAERARLRAGIEGLPGWRDPRYSGRFESVGLVSRESVLALLEPGDG